MAKKWEKDFRYSAIQASMELAATADQTDPFDYPFSFCLPVSAKPYMKGLSPGKISLIALVLGFAGLGAGAFIAAQADDQGNDWMLITVAACCSLGGMCCFFLPGLFQGRIVSWCIGDRGKELIAGAGGDTVMSCELGEADKVTISIEGEDHVLIRFDKANNRVLIEGVAGTYQIRDVDVLEIKPFGFMNYTGADITYSIGDETDLRLALAKVSLLKELIRQLPFLAFLQRWVKNSILEEVSETLGANDSLEIVS